MSARAKPLNHNKSPRLTRQTRCHRELCSQDKPDHLSWFLLLDNHHSKSPGHNEARSYTDRFGPSLSNQPGLSPENVRSPCYTYLQVQIPSIYTTLPDDASTHLDLWLKGAARPRTVPSVGATLGSYLSMPNVRIDDDNPCFEQVLDNPTTPRP